MEQFDFRKFFIKRPYLNQGLGFKLKEEHLIREGHKNNLNRHAKT